MESKENEILVKVQNVSKKFSLDLKTSLKYGAVDILRSTFGMKTSKELRPHEFWAVKDISFELRRGECIGLIGHNGAGKSTLLKVLNGLYAPDKGQITMKGKVGALIELGAGFNPILTGRENIYNNASILGFTRKEVEEKMQSIIDFAEIDQFLDMPVQNYSSGMKVRLGFAVAAHMDPDILIIDEVLAVGDLGFVIKCFDKIGQILPNTAVIFVSHSMQLVSRICNDILLLDHGKVEYHSKDIGKGIQMYFSKFAQSDKNVVYDNQKTRLITKSISLKNNIVSRRENFKITLEFEILNPQLTVAPHLYLLIKNSEQLQIAGVFINESKVCTTNKKTLIYDIEIKDPLFTLGKYTIDMGLNDIKTQEPIIRINNLFEFFVAEGEQTWVPIELVSACDVKFLEKK
ncbi:ABC transporter ATP-binding protein [Daejeonia sp. YH14]|uniref:ABC transporter ATP-binding protein n=1 Tax=Daejeonia sp. YH14 TaxID=3439042 RepID=UPI003F495377